MLKNLQTKFFLLLAMIVMGVGQLWAEDVTTTYTFTNRDWNATCNGEAANWTCGLRGSGYTANQGTQVATSANGANATSPISFTNVKSIVVEYCTNNKSGKGTIKVKVGNGTEQSFSVTAPSSGGTALKTKEFTFDPKETGTVKLTVDCSTNSIYINRISIITESNASPSSPLSSIAVNTEGATTTFHVGDAFTHDNVVVTATYEDESTKVVTDDATFSGYNMNTTGSQTVTVSYTEGEVTKTTSYNIEVLAIPELASISVDVTNATTKFYVGDTFTSEGVVVTATYNDQSTKDVTANATFSTPDMTTPGTKAVTVSYTEGEVEKTTSYNIDIPELVSISVDATNATTVFNQNGTFSYEGLVVTANYNDNSSKEVTSFNVPAPSLTTTGQKTVTVSYTEGEITKSAEYTITVNEYVQPTTVTIDNWSELFGVAADAGASVDKKDYTGNKDNVNVTYKKATNMYIKTNDLRIYNGSVLTFTAPEGYVIKELTFTGTTSADKAPSVNTGEFSYSAKKWNGSANSITFSRNTGSDYTKFVTVTLTLAEVSPLSSITVDASNATTTFHVGDAFTSEGVVVTATYEDESTKVVTDDATFSGYNMNTTGSQTVTVSYTEGEVEKTTSYNIEVLAIPELASISVDVTNATTKFYVGDTFTSEGVVVTATYNDQSTKDVTANATFSNPNMTTAGTKTVTVSYTEGEVEKTTSFNIDIPELESISVDATNATTVFNQNGTFSYEGLVVTAHYNDNSSKEVTGFNVPAPSLTTTAQKTVTVNYTEGEITKSAEYTITVNEYEQPTSVQIELKNSFFNSTGTSNVDDLTLTGSQDNITITINKNDGSKLYVNDTQIRLYNKNTFVVTAPEGYNITSIEFVEPSTNKSWSGSNNSSNPEGYVDGTKTWTGTASEVTITFGGTCRIAGINVTLAEASAPAPQTVTANIAAACTDGTLCYSTFSCSSAFVVPEDVIVAEIGIEDGKLDVRAYATGDIVPANTGVMISSATAGEKEFTLSTEDGTSVLDAFNALRATGDEGITADAMATVDPNSMYYRLTMHNGTQIGFWWGAPEGAAFSVAANKAYLVVPAAQAARMENFWFADGIITAINSVNVEKGTLNSDAPMYNLAGQRVSKSYKGVVIQNGKKYIVK